MANNAQKRKFLVIQLGGLEEFILSTGAFKAVREKLKDHHLTLLTTAAFVDVAKHTGYFNEVVADPLFEPFTEPFRYFNFLKAIRNARFDGVFDFMCIPRTEWYFRLLGRNKPDWSGSIPWASHPYLNPGGQMHLQDRLAEQLAVAGIVNIPEPDVSWMQPDIEKFKLPKEYALLFPGGKDYVFTKKDETGEEEVELPPRWRPQNFAEVATWLSGQGIMPVLLGAEDETAVVAETARLAGSIPVINLVGQAGIADITAMARGASIIIGNDNEAVWPAAATGRPTIIIFPALVNYRPRAPRGAHVRALEHADLDLLSSREVIRVAGELMALDLAAKSAKSAAPGGKAT